MEFVDIFGCRLPFMDQLKINQSQLCSDVSKVLEYQKEWNKIKQNVIEEEVCPMIKRCKRSMIKISESLHAEKAKMNTSDIYIKIIDPTLQLITDSYSYDGQSFIGDIGGTLGLLLGYSFMSAVDLIEFIWSRIVQKLFH